MKREMDGSLDRSFRLVPTAAGLQPVALQAEKREDREQDMTPTDCFFMSLAPFYPAVLPDPPMILPDFLGLILVALSLRFRGIQEIGSPLLGLPRSLFHPEYPDEPSRAEVVDQPARRRDLDFRDGPVEGFIGIHQPVGLEAGDPEPGEGADQLQVLDA